MNARNMTNRLLGCLLFAMALTANAAAYIDAGTGSIVTQVLIAGALGAALTFKSFWHALRRILTKGIHR